MNTKEEILTPCLLALAKAGIVVEKNIEKMNLLTNSVLQLTDGYTKICTEHLDFIKNDINPLQVVMECEEEQVKKKSSFINFKDFLLSRQNQEDFQIQTAQQQEQLQSFSNNQTYQQNKLYSQKSVDTLSFQLSQIKIDKSKDASISNMIEEEIINIDPKKELQQRESEKLDQYYAEQKKKLFQDYQIIFEKEQSRCNSSKWFEDADIQYELSPFKTYDNSSENSHRYSWRDDDESISKDINPYFINECSMLNQGTNDNELLLNHFTPKKKRLFCNNKKIPTWAQNLDVINYSIKNVQSNWEKQKQDPCQLFGVLSEKALKQAIKIQNQLSSNSQMQKRQYNYLTEQIQEVDSQRVINLERLKKHQQDSSKKFQDYKRNERLAKGCLFRL